MAEYIRRTGDDEGVALAVEELMREGLVSSLTYLVSPLKSIWGINSMALYRQVVSSATHVRHSLYPFQ